MPPGVPQDVCPPALVLFCLFRRGVEVCQAALVEPPPCVVVLNAAALHQRAVPQGAERIAAVVVHIGGAEWSRVLVLLLVVATESITCTQRERHTTINGTVNLLSLF